MGLWTTVMVVLPIVVIAVLVWNYRRQAAAREAASAERLKAFLSASAAAKASSGMAESVGASGGSTGLAVNTTGSAPNKAAQPARTLGAGVVAPVKVPGMPATPARPPVATGFTARPQLTSTAHLAVTSFCEVPCPVYGAAVHESGRVHTTSSGSGRVRARSRAASAGGYQRGFFDL